MPHEYTRACLSKLCLLLVCQVNRHCTVDLSLEMASPREGFRFGKLPYEKVTEMATFLHT